MSERSFGEDDDGGQAVGTPWDMTIECWRKDCTVAAGDLLGTSGGRTDEYSN